MTAPLLSVKFFIPKPNKSLVKRSPLIERFSVSLERPITLISAPAGFGKTSLLTSWIEQNRTKPNSESAFRYIAWLSFDPMDNQPDRFWVYFLSALQVGVSAPILGNDSASPIQLSSLIELLQSDSPPDLYSVLDSLINQIISLIECDG